MRASAVAAAAGGGPGDPRNFARGDDFSALWGSGERDPRRPDAPERENRPVEAEEELEHALDPELLAALFPDRQPPPRALLAEPPLAGEPPREAPGEAPHVAIGARPAAHGVPLARSERRPVADARTNADSASLFAELEAHAPAAAPARAERWVRPEALPEPVAPLAPAAHTPRAPAAPTRVHLAGGLSVAVHEAGGAVSVRVEGPREALEGVAGVGPELEAALSAGGFSLGEFSSGESGDHDPDRGGRGEERAYAGAADRGEVVRGRWSIRRFA